jgi:hypothetical protein
MGTLSLHFLQDGGRTGALFSVPLGDCHSAVRVK